ncbi:MAG: extracellular solute-binding protein [Aigarchaeota archaeon]|nr:extracellular solute-binding protein [Aigarchaeota archaeon]MCX8193663.1 extracellular solute-binding protein [Nitrososphaeria archaeon]
MEIEKYRRYDEVSGISFPRSIIIVTVIAVVVVAAISAYAILLTQPGKVSGKIIAFVWEDYTMPEVADNFTKLYPDIIVEYSIFTDQPEMFTKLKAGFKADVISPCVDYIPSLVKAGLIQPIDPSRLKNWNKLFKDVREYPGIWFDGKLYMVPTDMGSETAVVFRKDKVSFIESWMDVFKPEYKEKILIIDDPRLGIVIGAFALGYEDPWNLSREDLEKIKEFYRERRDLILGFYESDLEVRDMLASGEAWIAAGPSPTIAYWLISEGIDAGFTFPEGKGTSWFCGMSIVKDAQNLDAVYTYIDYIISKEVELYFAEEWLYSPSNEEAYMEISPEVRGWLTSPELFQKLIPLTEPPNIDEWLEVWEEIVGG